MATESTTVRFLATAAGSAESTCRWRIRRDISYVVCEKKF
jgi:hypothetical protein